MLGSIVALAFLDDLSEGGVVSFSAVSGKQLEFTVNTYLADFRSRVGAPENYVILDFSLSGASAGGLLGAQMTLVNTGAPVVPAAGILPVVAGIQQAEAVIVSAQDPGPAQGSTPSIGYGLNELLRTKIADLEAARPGGGAFFSGNAGSGDGRVWSMGLLILIPSEELPLDADPPVEEPVEEPLAADADPRVSETAVLR